MLDRRIVRWAGALVAALGATSALGFENTIRVVVDPARHWQCGDGFFPNGGSETYRHLRVSADGAALGEFDLALPSECTKVLEYFTDVPADTTIDIRVEAGGNVMAAPIVSADRNRVSTVNAFVDSAWGELTTDYADARGPASTEPVGSTHTNLIQLRIAPERQWQCGDNFFATGGSETYRYGYLSIDGIAVPDYDFADPADCARVERVTLELEENAKSSIVLTVGPYTMGTDLTAPGHDRDWYVNFFVDQIWGEVARDGN